MAQTRLAIQQIVLEALELRFGTPESEAPPYPASTRDPFTDDLLSFSRKILLDIPSPRGTPARAPSFLSGDIRLRLSQRVQIPMPRTRGIFTRRGRGEPRRRRVSARVSSPCEFLSRRCFRFTRIQFTTKDDVFDVFRLSRLDRSLSLFLSKFSDTASRRSVVSAHDGVPRARYTRPVSSFTSSTATLLSSRVRFVLEKETTERTTEDW